MKIYFTDGSCSPNPGPGGFAVVESGKPVAIGKETQSTNIRMEGEALIAALELASGEVCEIRTDSELWIKIITLWAPGWEANGWRKSRGEIKNLDLVKKLCELYADSQANLVWVKAHVGTDGNELADEWANKARSGETL